LALTDEYGREKYQLLLARHHENMPDKSKEISTRLFERNVWTSLHIQEGQFKTLSRDDGE
jgi:hypothetical protein